MTNFTQVVTAAALAFGLSASTLAAPPAPAPSAAPAAGVKAFRPPAVPLVTSDPYLSIWSEADHLTDDNTQHWTRHDHSLVSLIRVDGKAFRLMGKEPPGVPAMPQVGLQVLPTRSIYDFEDSQRPRHADLHDRGPAAGSRGPRPAAELPHLAGALRGRRRPCGVALRQHQLGAGGQHAGEEVNGPGKRWAS